jgi:hypothetical protein
MPKKHHAGLPAELKIHSDEVQWFFIENYYDGPISGLAIFKNQIVQFCCFQEDIPEHYIYVLHQLSADALSKAHHAKSNLKQWSEHIGRLKWMAHHLQKHTPMS